MPLTPTSRPFTTNKKAFRTEGVCNNRTDSLPDPHNQLGQY
ncbi:hypothetical protein EC990713_2228 [Escherichia coli 99.0713]|nr:hypothetical protein EC990713_2228 [Escherichia coli 99.0713]